ncbi:hypothetical protein L0666_05990 [Octadecabacter sp. CECT 8868]|uniref:hypothetical protein n=1 Tax=Octadecabacter algicola TaxID=2909342 RepID=UPI001F20A22E|nr:hypothetical protein [Octadecabacter algicola]MCF2904530.1 hypothetical protein [Octadecabacter algicola]
MSAQKHPNQMPELIKLYIKSCLIGFLASAVFVGLLIGFDVKGLRGLIMGSDIGIVAVMMIWIFNGIVFAGVQFAFAIMSMADDDDDEPRGGRPVKVFLAEPIPVRVDRPAQRRQG